MNVLVRQTVRARAGALTPSVRRRMGGDDLKPEDAVRDVKLWRALTFGSIFFCAGLYQVIAASMHHPVYPDKTMPYMQKRSKAFPWGDGDTPLFAQLFGYPHGHPKADEHHH